MFLASSFASWANDPAFDANPAFDSRRDAPAVRSPRRSDAPLPNRPGQPNGNVLIDPTPSSSRGSIRVNNWASFSV
jgi:hypothetical protein